MGLLDQAGGALGAVLGGAQGAGTKAMLMQQVVAMLSKPGALDNLMAAFKQNGLGNILESWLGKGQNLPISPDQVQKVLGAGALADIAKKAGMGVPDAATALSGLLPDVVDKISPQGAMPTGADLGGMLSAVGKLFR